MCQSVYPSIYKCDGDDDDDDDDDDFFSAIFYR